MIYITYQEEFVHQSVLLNETIEGLNCRPGLTYIDATAGGGGHSEEIAKRIYPTGRLISIDADPAAIEATRKRLVPWEKIVTIVKENYFNIPKILRELNIEKISGGIVFDLGTSYYQLTSAERGFSFSKEAPLDMRIDPENPTTAYDIVNKFSENELVRIFSEYGEERFSKRIAKKIVQERKLKPIQTTTELANLVKSATPPVRSKIHPATRIFQAIRIAVNHELENLENTLKGVIPLLEKNARIAVISFHSLEDRLVKNTFKYYSLSCKCLPNELNCTCGPRQLEIITKKPIIPTGGEIEKNPSARSAKLRFAQKIL